MHALVEITAEKFRSLQNVTIPLGPLSVLVGPNNAGKSNVLDLIRFLSDSVRFDLDRALDIRGGIERVKFRGGSPAPSDVKIGIKAQVTTYSSRKALDEYNLEFRLGSVGGQRQRTVLIRKEEFRFKRYGGAGRRITIQGQRAQIVDDQQGQTAPRKRGIGLQRSSLGLSTLPKLADDEGGLEVRKMAELFDSFRVFDIDVDAAREPARLSGERLADDASNLAAFLMVLSRDEDLWQRLEADAQSIVPGLDAIQFEPIGGPSRAVSVVLRERGLRGSTLLADASYGTIRVLALLALLYDPEPPQITCIEEIDHGLHPHSFDILVDRLREASTRTQFLIATHSPVLVNRLHPSEIVVCERLDSGGSHIPAIDPNEVVKMIDAAEGEIGPGELWFAGSLGGIPA
jgi:predicted ATPase